MNPITRKSVLYGAEQCVCGEREQDYGSPENNFQTIANMWCDYIARRYPKSNVPLDAHDVAIMMCLLKISRIASGQIKEDNYIDLAGYAACAGEVISKMEDWEI